MVCTVRKVKKEGPTHPEPPVLLLPSDRQL
jgi:hypothetical protein